jgi:protocatechuate 3,4-dioxygenase beta subunit
MHRTAAALLAALLALPALAAITGSVMTTDGAPISGARVMLYSPESPEARRARVLSDSPERVPLATAQTDSRGNWSLESPKEPVADLRVVAAGYEPWARRIERDEEVGAAMLFKADMKQGTVRAGGKPVAGATVTIGYGGAEYLTRTDDQGKYEAPDPKRSRVLAVFHPSWAIDDEVFTSTPPQNALNRTLTAGTSISGRVVGPDGTTPVPKAAITVDNWPLAVSGDDGTFTIPHAPSKWSSVIAQSGSLFAMRAASTEKTLTLRLAKPATVSGRVLDAKTKLPVAGANVRISVRSRGMLAEGWSALTDAKGTYSLNVPPGTYSAVMTHPGYNPQPLDVTVAAGQSSAKDFSATPMARVSGVVMSEDRKPVAAAVISGEEVADDFSRMGTARMMAGNSPVSGPDGKFSTRVQGDTDLRIRANRKGLPIAKSESFRLAPGDRRSGVVVTIPNGIAVTGKVTDREGKPLSGVAVTAAEAAAGRGGMIRQMIMIGGPASEEDPVRTGSDGTFTIRVKEGTYDFSFRREGYSAKVVRGQTITTSAPASIETTLAPAVEITGRVVRNGAGIDGVTLTTFSEAGLGAAAVTGPDGSFTLTGLTPGDVRANVRKETEFIQEMRTFTAPARDVVIEIPTGTTVSGRVIDKESRKPLASFQAGISTSRSGGGMVMMAPPQLRTFTNDDGTFTLDNVPLGGVNLIANAPGYAQARLNVTLEEGKPLRGVELELDPGTKLVGKVTGPDGAALSGASVRVAPFGSGGMVMPGNTKQTVSDASGEYVLEALEPTDTNIEFSHPKYVGTRKEITVKGREVHLDVQLSAGQRVSGVVVTEAGAPVPEAEVEAMAGAGTFRTARSDANGQFTFDSLVPARYRFTAAKRGYSESRLDDVDIASGAPIRLVLRGGATIYGQVLGLAAEEVSAATVEARGGDGSFSSTTVDSAGNFRLEGAPIGTVRVSAVVSRNFTSRKSSAPQTVTIAAGESQNVNLEFRSDTVIRGRVLRNQRPLSSAGVNFTPKRGSSTQAGASATTDEQGNYTITGLEPGEYSVMVIDMQRFTPYQTTYEVRGSATFDIEYKANALRGRVMSSEGDPIADARVTLRSTTSEGPFRGDLAAGTDVNGTFTIDSVAPGTYTVAADKSGYGNYVTEVTVTEDGAPDVELKLSKNPGVTLKIVDARGGRSLSGTVYVFDNLGRFVQDSGRMFGGGMESAADAQLSLAPGSYVATVTSMGYAPVSVNLVSPGTQTVAMSPGGKVIIRSTQSDIQRIRLVDSRGQRYPHLPNRPPASDLSPSPAQMQLDNVAPGTYRVEVLTSSDTTAIKSVPVVVTEGGVVVVDV